MQSTFLSRPCHVTAPPTLATCFHHQTTKRLSTPFTSVAALGSSQANTLATHPLLPSSEASNANAPQQQQQPPLPSVTATIRSADASDYWAIADCHVRSFYPRAGSWDPFLRLDRVISLIVGKEREEVQHQGKFSCLVAVDPVLQNHDAGAAAFGALANAIAKWLLPPSARKNYAINAIAAGLAGAVVIDTLMEHVPQRKTTGSLPPRKHVAYLSNLAVHPDARRRGIGLELLRNAERVAAEWGCRSMALHVDPENKAAMALYKSAGYRVVAAQTWAQQWLEGRNSPLVLMVRLLPQRQR